MVQRYCPHRTIEKRLLENKFEGQKKGSTVAAENKRQARQKRTQEIRNFAKAKIGELTERDKFLAGIALYAAEGNKIDGKGGFANAHPKIIKFMINWLTTYTKISPARLRGALWLYEEKSEISAKQFWSELNRIKLDQFHKTYIVKIKDSKKIRKNIHEHGGFRIRFSDSTVHRRIMGWIYALFNDKITITNIPR